jgi:hypothetical protein
VLRVVLPVVVGSLVILVVLVVFIVVINVIVVHVNVHRAGAPAAVPAPRAAPGGSECNTGSEGDCRSRRIITRRRIRNRRIRIDRRRGSIHDGGVVCGNVNNIGTGLLHQDDLFASLGLSLHLLLLRRFKSAFALGFRAHALHRVHHLGFLSQKGVPEIRCPLNVVRHPVHDIGERCHRLDARVPVLFLDCSGERLVLQILVLLQPLLELDDLKGIGRSHQCLAQKLIWIKSNRRNERIELLVGNLLRFLRHYLGFRLLRRRRLCKKRG